MTADKASLTLRDLHLCFEGVIPAVIATAAADGTPNVTYLSRTHIVDDERLALSNQFFSKTSRNLAENPRASVLVIDPDTYDQFRLLVVYERTERRGPVFEQLRKDVDAVAAIEGMQGVFRLRAADIYRVVHIEQVLAAVHRRDTPAPRRERTKDVGAATLGLAELTARLSRCPDLDTLVSATVDGLAELLGHEHSVLLLLDERGERLFTIASHGYDTQGVGSEVPVGEGVIGTVAATAAPMRIGNLRHMNRYSRIVRQGFEDEGEIGPGRQIALPGLEGAGSRLAVPAMAYGQLVGVLAVESTRSVAYDDTDEALLSTVATLVANAIETGQWQDRADDAPSGPTRPTRPGGTSPGARPDRTTHVRFFAVDGSTFLDGDYLIKGVAGRLLWSLLDQYESEGRTDFTNKEMRLDPSLELPEFRDNFENRLILLKRRLDERDAPVRIDRTGRGRFRLVVDTDLRLEQV